MTQPKKVSKMGRRAVLAGVIATPITAACQSFDPALLEGLGGIVNSGNGFGLGNTGGLTQADAASGIREALANGVVNAVTTVGKTDGYFGDSLIKILLPDSLQSVHSTLNRFGAGGLLDNLQLQLNRGAEKAAPLAKDLFVDVISSLSITDAINIVRGPSNAATSFLQTQTTPRLVSLFSPIMTDALQDTGALQLVDQVSGSLRNIPFAPQLGSNARTDLISHGVEKGLDGMFYYIGEQEADIRANPAERTSDILRRVFG